MILPSSSVPSSVQIPPSAASTVPPGPISTAVGQGTIAEMDADVSPGFTFGAEEAIAGAS